ncbi:uncharacterized protein B0H18DRAFT_1127828 [Fomitopsis serialis]|uniref:uncharacterized protein n=1 Tax=Fomitopsis serialis TaxID=139415 RepID=UPI0020083306|nr:uncharacterized protein B0H18DRAFT_1127828 [Neoantrodia serialis]KAH9911895.1 hypothetical protein B0H18DRAFT_1127828 [Neoantrodia serialis]
MSKPKSHAGVFVSHEWILAGQQFANTPSYVREVLASLLTMPSGLEIALFGVPSTTVRAFIANGQVPILSPGSPTPSTQDFFSAEPSTLPTFKDLRALPVPPVEMIDKLFRAVGEEWLAGKVSIHYAHLISTSYATSTGANSLVPLYILSFWRRVHRMRSTYTTWKTAETWLLTSGRAPGPLTDSTRLLLTRIPHSGRLGALEGKPDTIALASFLSREWLASEHIGMICNILRTDIDMDDHLRGRHAIWDAYWTWLLWSRYVERAQVRSATGKPIPPPKVVLPAWLVQFGERLASGDLLSLSLVFNLNGAHWIAVVVDFRVWSILFADSMGHSIPPQLHDLLQWWLTPYAKQQLSVSHLPCMRQAPGDYFSCGICAPNAIAHYYLPDLHPLILPDMVDSARMVYLERIWKISQSSPVEAATSTPDFTDSDLGGALQIDQDITIIDTSIDIPILSKPKCDSAAIACETPKVPGKPMKRKRRPIV